MERDWLSLLKMPVLWYPNKVGKAIAGTHAFEAVYCVGLLTCDDSGYVYSVTQFDDQHSPTWRVSVNEDFTDWKVEQIQ